VLLNVPLTPLLMIIQSVHVILTITFSPIINVIVQDTYLMEFVYFNVLPIHHNKMDSVNVIQDIHYPMEHVKLREVVV